MVERKPIGDIGKHLQEPGDETNPFFETASASAEDFAFDYEPVPWEELLVQYAKPEELIMDGNVSDVEHLPLGEWDISVRPHPGTSGLFDWEAHLIFRISNA